MIAVVEEILGDFLQGMWENKKKKEKGEKKRFEHLRSLCKTSAGTWSDEDTRENGFFFLFV